MSEVASSSILFVKDDASLRYKLVRVGSYKLAKDIVPGAGEFIDFQDGFLDRQDLPKQKAEALSAEDSDKDGTTSFLSDGDEFPSEADTEDFFAGFEAALGR